MNPYDEKRLRDEVIYLHSLWHQGPPTNLNPNPNLNNPDPRPSSSRIPHVPNPTPFYYTPNYPFYYQQTPNPNPITHYPLYHQQTPNLNSRSNYPLYHQETTISYPRPKPNPRNSLQPTNPTSFKKENTTTTTGKNRLKEKRAKTKKKKNKRMSQADPPLDSGPEWPCLEPPLEPALNASGWPALKSVSTPKDRSLSAKECAHFAAIQIQYKAAEAFREFFMKMVGSNTNEDEDEFNVDDEDYEMSEEESEENEEFKFFLNIFVEDYELRSYFEKNYETGDFCCLVCRGIGKKGWKRFKGCVGLVQHSIAILKTKRRRAHRAFGQVVCKVLGWDIDRFPTIVLKDWPLGRSMAKPELQGDPEDKGNDDDNKDDSAVTKENLVSANDASGENAVSTNGCNGENAVSINSDRGENALCVNGSSKNGVYVNEDNGENAVSVNSGIGEHVVSVRDDNGDDKEVCHVHQSGC